MRPWGVKRLFRFSYRTRDEVHADIADEFAFHLDMRVDELMRAGLDEADARARAAREFGDRTSSARGCARTGERLERRRRVGQLASVQGELRRLDPGVALANPRALDQALAGSMIERRVVLALVGAFAAAALLLACVGLYGVLAYTVATRRREIGVRMALGAARSDVIRHVVRSALSMVAIGLLIGLAGALGAAWLLASELYHVRGYDPLVLTGAVLTISIVALAASAVPAWKASRVSPATALRAN